MARKAIQEFGRIDVLVNSTAYTGISLETFHGLPPEYWHGEINTTLKGTLNFCEYFCPKW